MPLLINKYLKHNKLTEIRTVNRLFVSTFVSVCNIKINNNLFIKQFLIHEDDDDYSAFCDFISRIGVLNSMCITLEDMVSLFEFVISPADRIVTGAVYTPPEIRNKIIRTCLDEMTVEQLTNIRISDISCGCGGFLMDVALLLHKKTKRSFYDIYRYNIYGIDIQAYSVERTQILLSLLALIYNEDRCFDFHILQADTLDFNTNEWNKDYSRFDVIIGNPPYVCSRKVSDETKAKMLTYKVCKSGHPDLYMPFFQIATEMLVEDGKLGFITMNSFIRSVNGRAVRDYFSQENHDVFIEDFRGYQIFHGKSTYTCLFFLTKGIMSGVLHYSVKGNSISSRTLYSEVPYEKLDNKKGWALNDIEYVSKIELVGIPIAKYCKSRHGIATLSNKTYVFKPVSEDSCYFYLKEKNDCFPIEKGICRDIVNSNKFNSDVSFESIVEKLIFPYIVLPNNKVVIIEEALMMKTYPCAYSYLKSQLYWLNKRDKGKTQNYPAWYAYGRTQSLVMPRYKLFYPKFANKPLRCVLRDDDDLMLYNGVSFVSDNIEHLQILKCVLDSDIFWKYVVKNAKPYSSDYYSLSGVDIKNFGIPEFTKEEEMELLSLQSQKEINEWLIPFYS